MAKPMLVTVPFVLLLLDVWPLARLSLPPRRATPAADRHRRRKAAPAGTPWSVVLIEKTPFFALSAAASAITYLVQRSTGAMEVSGTLPLGVRLTNAVVAYGRYLVMTVWPRDLSVFYPYDTDLPAWQVIGAVLALMAITATTLAYGRRRPYAVVGWLLYLGMLVPVIGLVQVGSQALADRYTYLPLIGIFILLVWGGGELLARAGVAPALQALLLAGVVAGCAALASAQVGVWRTGETLFTHAVQVTRANYLAHNNLGVALEAEGRFDAAIEQYREALRIKPDYDHARANLARALRGRYEHAAAADPNDAVAQYNLATALRDTGNGQEAIVHYQEAIRLQGDYVAAHTDLGGLLSEVGHLDEAVPHFEQALRVNPDDVRTRFNYGSTLARMGRLLEAVEQYQRVVRLAPDDAEAWGNLAMAHAALHQTAEAARAEQRAVELARAQGQWTLVQTLDQWWEGYRSGAALTE